MKTSQKARGLGDVRSRKNIKSAHTTDIWSIRDVQRKGPDLYPLTKKRDMLKRELRALNKKRSAVEKEFNTIDEQVKNSKGR